MRRGNEDRRRSIARILHYSCSGLLLLLTVYLTVLAMSKGLTLFSLHPIFMAIAVRTKIERSVCDPCLELM